MWEASDVDSLVLSLPDSRYYGYIELLNYFLDYSHSESQDIMNELENCTEQDDIDYLKDELVLSRMRIEVFTSKIAEYNKEEELQSECDKSTGKREFVYLKSKAGNPLVLSDLEEFEDDALDDMKKAWTFLKNGEFTSDPTKYKMISNQKQLKGVREVKEFQSRMFFYHLEKEIVLVFLALVKKADNPKKELEKILNRTHFMRDSLRSIRASLADPMKREEMLKEGKEITERIDLILGSKKVGGK